MKMKTLDRKLDYSGTKRSYKKVVWFYHFWSRLTESKAAKFVIELANIKDGKTILEVACGTGIVFEQIVKRNPNGKNIGIDLSTEMLAKAERRLRKHNNVHYELRESNVLNLNFNENSFDLIINNFMIDLMPSEYFDRIANEFYKILKPGGYLIISTFSFGKKKVNKFWYWIAKKFPALLTGCRPVSFEDNLINSNFKIEKILEISQNTFPSVVIKARK